MVPNVSPLFFAEKSWADSSIEQKLLYTMEFTMRYIINRLALGLFLLSGPPLLAQVVNQPVVDSTIYTAEQRSQLLQLAKSLKTEMEAEKARAEAIARELGKPLSYVVDGNLVELVGFNDDGTLRYYTTDNDNAAHTISTNKVYPGGSAGLSLTGSNITLGVWDGGEVVANHQEFMNTGTSRVTQVDAATLTASSDHATHVSGTMIGAGVSGNTNARGMAYGAELLAHDWDSDAAEMVAAAANGLQISNHSYGILAGWEPDGHGGWDWYGNSSISTTEDYRFGFYNFSCRSIDGLAVSAPYYLIVKAAGNDRGEDDPSSSSPPADGPYDCIAYWGIAKNVMTVGAVEDIPNGYSQPSDVVMSSFSGWGPADDGRIKPDIVANGVSLRSASTTYPTPSTTLYESMSGTSMATPNVSGSLGLLLEHQRNLHGSGRMLSSTLKGLVIHTADEAGPNPGPDYMHGWGLMNTAKAAQLMTADANFHPCGYIREYELQDGETLEFTISVDGSAPLRTTICWTDPAGTPVAASLDPTNKMLLNDLDLRVISASGTIYEPWTLDPANPANAATTGDNNTDNVEQVLISSPTAGSYTVRITHKGTLSGGLQEFSIITTGNQIDQDLVLSNQTVNTTRYYQALNTITAGKLFSPSGFVVDVAGDVVMEAGHSITLKPGFHAKADCKFHARIAPCAADAYGRAGVASQEPLVGYPVQPHHRLSHYPNPAADKVTITYTVELAGKAELTVVDIYGNTIAKLVDNNAHNAGTYTADFDTSRLPSGVYFYSIRTAGYKETRQIVVVH